MIATILPGSSNFHAVGYNEHKVSKGLATLVEILNFDALEGRDVITHADLVKYLKEYSSVNPRIAKPQFHVAISCKGQEMTEQELLEFAHEYLKEMGYGEPGQPVLIYAHHDTANLHLHIVTTRVGVEGKKIDDHNERRRSQAIIDRILGIDRKKKTEKDYADALGYKFSSLAQFKAVMASMGYEFYHKETTAFIKRGGRVQKKVEVGDIAELCATPSVDRQKISQIRKLLLKYRDISADKEELQVELKKNFGIDVVFFGPKDNPLGYHVIDHRSKTVIPGARLLRIGDLLDFATAEERFNRAEAFINDLFDQNPKVTQDQIFRKLLRYRTYIKKGVIHTFDGEKRELPKYMADALKRNAHIAWIESFNPTTDEEADILCTLCKMPEEVRSRISLSAQRNGACTHAVERIAAVFSDPDVTNVRSALRAEGVVIRESEGTFYAVDFGNKAIVNLNEQGFDVVRLIRNDRRKQKSETPKVTPPAKKQAKGIRPTQEDGASHSQNREWEVGPNSRYDDIDDGTKQGMKLS